MTWKLTRAIAPDLFEIFGFEDSGDLSSIMAVRLLELCNMLWLFVALWLVYWWNGC